jgi:hypothetical protein
MANEFTKALRYGLDQPTENIATTLDLLGYDDAAGSLQNLVDAPENYESAAARFLNPEGEGYNWKDLPLATVEQAGQLAGSIGLRAAGAGVGTVVGSPVLGAILAFGGPALFESIQIAGPVALERARNNGREEPNGEDWAGAMGTAGFSGVLNAIGVKGIPKLNAALGTTGKTIAQTAGAGLREGVTEGLQGATEQVGGTALTDKGLTIDVKQAVGEGLLGSSAGTTIQGPIALRQAQQQQNIPPTTPDVVVEETEQDLMPNEILENVRQSLAIAAEQTPDLAIEEMDPLSRLSQPATPEEAVANMEALNNIPTAEQRLAATAAEEGPLAGLAQNLLDDNRTQTQTTQGSLDTFFQNAPETIDPAEDGAVQNEQEVRSAFVNAFRDQMTQRAEEYGVTLTDRGRRNALLDAQNYAIDHFEFFDPRTHNVNDIRDQVRMAVDNAVDARLQAQSVDAVVLQGDKRFETPTDRTIQDVYKTEEAVDRMGRTVQVPNIDYVPSGSPREGITSAETGIDPVFMSTTTLVPALANLPLTMDGEFAMKQLGIKEDGNWFAAAKPKQAGQVREAIDSGVASLLQSKIAKKEIVTREEIANQFYDHLSRFKTIVKYNEETTHEDRHKWDLVIPPYSDFKNSFDDVELWTMYDAKIPEGELEQDSAYYNTLNDDMHNPHGIGTNFWVRGTVVQEEGVPGRGLHVSEVQSQLHEKGNDPDQTEVYLSEVSREEETDIAPIRARIEAVQTATNTLADEISELGDYENYPRLPKIMATDIAEYMTGQKDFLNLPDISVSGELMRLSDEFKVAKLAAHAKYEAKAGNVFLDRFLEEMPLEQIGLSSELFTKAKIKEGPSATSRVTDSPFAVTRRIKQMARENGIDLEEMSVIEPNGDVAQAFEEIKQLEKEAEVYTEEHYSELHALTEEYIPILARKYPAIRELSLKAERYPNKEDQARLTAFEETRYDTPTVPDYPFKKNWAGAGLKTAIIHAIDAGNLDYVYLPSNGYGGAPSSPYKQIQKEAKKIAQQISELTGIPVNEIYTKIPDKSQGTGGAGPHFRLDIRQLKQLIEAKIFPGFTGYKKGGLVTKAQGAGYSMNLGNYGRNYT